MATKKNGTVEKQEIDALKKIVESQGKTIDGLRKIVEDIKKDFGELGADFLEISSTIDDLSLRARRTISRYKMGSEAKIERGVHGTDFLEELIEKIASVKEEMESMGNEK